MYSRFCRAVLPLVALLGCGHPDVAPDAPDVRIGVTPFAIPIGPADGGITGTYPSNVHLKPVFVTSLSSLPPTNPHQSITVDGYRAAGDGGGGIFFWDSTSTATPDGGIFFAVTGVGTGRWHRAYAGAASVRWYGATGDGVTDDTAALDAAAATCVSAGNGDLYFPVGTYKRSGTALAPQGRCHLRGAGNSTLLTQSTAGVEVITATDAGDFSVSDMKIVSSGGAHAVHVISHNGTPQHPTLERLEIDGFGSPGTTVTGVNLTTGVFTSPGHGLTNGAIAQLSRPIGPLGSSSTFTVPPVFSAAGNFVTIAGVHATRPLATNDPIQFSDQVDQGFLPTGISNRHTYFVVNIGVAGADTFQVSATSGGGAIAFTGDGLTHAQLFAWGVAPTNFDFRKHYFVVGAVAGVSFQLSATSGGPAIVPGGGGIAGTSNLLVGQAFGGIVFDAQASSNMYSPRVADVLVYAPANNDGGARWGIATIGSGPGADILHVGVFRGEIANCKRALSSTAGGMYVDLTHAYNSCDGSGGGMIAYANVAEGVRAQNMRIEWTSTENSHFFDVGSADCQLKTNAGAEQYMISDLGVGNEYDTGGISHSTTVGAAQYPRTTTFIDLRQRFILDNGFGLNFVSAGGIRELYNNGFANGGYIGALATSTPAAISTVGAATSTFDIEGYVDVFHTAMDVEITIVARRVGGSRGTGAIDDAASFVRRMLIKDNGVTTSIVGGTVQTPVADIVDADLAAAGLTGSSISFSIAPSTQFLRLSVTGVANVNLAWTFYAKFKAISS